MKSSLRKSIPTRDTNSSGPPRIRWRDYFAQWLMVGLFALCSLGNVAWANEPPIYISGSANPTTINVGETIRFESVWHDPEDDFVVGARVKYCHQNTSNCVTEFLDYIEGTEHPRVGAEIQVSITEVGTYDYQFFAVDAEPVDNPLHRDEELDWYDGGTFTVVDNTTTPITPDNPVTPPPSQGSTNCTQVTEIPQSECEALVALYNSTNGLNWSDSPANNWNMTNEPCSWEGVHCDCNWESWNQENEHYNDCHIIDINRWNSNLIGTLPYLSALSKLQRIDLSANQLSGEILPSLSTLGNLSYLRLWGNCLTASDPTLIAFLDEKNPDWKGSQRSKCFSGAYTVSGMISLPIGDVIPDNGIDISINLDIYDENNDYLESGGSDQVHISENQSSVPFLLLIPDEPNVKWTLQIDCSDWEWDENLGESIRSGKCDRYAPHLLYGKSGMTMTYRYDNFFQGGQNYPNANLVLQHGVQISGMISLPEGRVAPAGGIDEIWVAINEPDADVFYGWDSFKITEGQSSVPYTIRVVNDPQVEWKVEVWCWRNECNNNGEYVKYGYYNPAGTTADSFSVTLLPGGQNHSNINLTLIPLDAETPIDDTQPPTVTISSHPPTTTINDTDSISISGTASFNEFQKITWENNHGNGGEVFISEMDALINGTAIWNKDNIPLKVGENIITVTVYDKTGLQGSASLTVTLTITDSDVTPQPQPPNFTISNVHPNGSENEHEYDRTERPLTVWWDTSDISHSTEVFIFLQPVPADGAQYFMHLTQNDEQETFIISDEVDAGEWNVCLYTVPTQEPPVPICASGNITIQ